MDKYKSNYDEHQWLQELYVQAPVAIDIYIGKEFIIEFANPLMCEIWGYPKAQVVNMPLFDDIPEARGQGFEEILANVLASGEPFVGNELLVSKS